MKKYVLLFGIILTGFILTSTTTKNKNAGEKIKVAHVTNKQEQQKEIIEIKMNDLNKHLAHGDIIVK